VKFVMHRVYPILGVPDTLSIVNISTAPVEAAATADPPSVDDGRARRWDTHRAERRRELVKIAVAAIDTLGPMASMEDIAVAAGTSKSVFYRYFDDKAGLQEAVADRVLRRVRREVLAAVDEEHDPAEALRRMLGVYLQLIERSPNVYAYVTSDFSSEEIRGFFKTIIELMRASLDTFLETVSVPEASRAMTLEYWPPSAVGMIRAASESWLYSPADSRPTLNDLRDHLTGWLTLGVLPTRTTTTETS
jgi:AcrR family transcriptional regulator